MPKSTNQRDAIVQAALKLFASRGYASTPVSQIAKAARVSQGLMYNFFASKEDLLITIMTSGFSDIAESLKAYESEPVPRQALAVHIRSTIAIVKEKRAFWQLLHAIRLQEKVATAMQETYLETVQHVTGIFKRIFKKMGFPNPELEALLFLAQIDGLVVLYLQNPRTPIDRLGETLIKRYIS